MAVEGKEGVSSLVLDFGELGVSFLPPCLRPHQSQTRTVSSNSSPTSPEAPSSPGKKICKSKPPSNILPPPSLFNNRLPPPFLFLLPSLLCPLSSGPTSLCGPQPLSPRSRSLQSFKAPAAPKRTFFPLERAELIDS